MFEAIRDYFTGLAIKYRDWKSGRSECVSTSKGLKQARSSKWPSVRRKFLNQNPKCQWCGSVTKLEIHHCIPFHVEKSLELENSNLLTLCEKEETRCHLVRGHLGNYRYYNENVKSECLAHQKELSNSQVPSQCSQDTSKISEKS